MAEARSAPTKGLGASLLKMVGERVRARRKQQGLSRRVLSELSNVSPRYLAQLETGEGNISISLLAKVAIALQCDLAQLVGNTAINTYGCDNAEICDDGLHRIFNLLREADLNTRSRVLALLEEKPAARQQRICLIGLRGAGKSTLGGRAGEALDIPFVELNEEIEQLAGIPVAEVIALYGADGYRQLEAKAIDTVVADNSRVILAAAGGVVSNPRTYDRVLKSFNTIWLRAAPAEHMQRVLAQGDTRPMAGNPAAMAQLKKLLSDRETDYARACCVVDTQGLTVAQSLQRLLAVIRQLQII